MTARRSSARRGFTLLEVLLALALTVVLLSLLTFSISVYLRASNAGRDEVERAQLARVLLRRISDDLRSTVWRHEAEQTASSSGSSSSSSGQGGSSGSGGSGTSGTGGSSGSGGSGASGGSGSGTGGSGSSGTGDSSNSSTSVADSTELPAVTGLFGNQYEVQIDVSRLPRVEQYASALANTSDLVSDVKTVAYFYQASSSGVSTSAGGLVRREFDRAVTTFASTNGDISAWEQGLAPLAEEVTAVEFRYRDGNTWVTEWDSQAKKALPLAVEVAIQLSGDAAATLPTTSPRSAAPTTTATTNKPQIYRLLVFIPQSQAPAVSGASAMETMVSAAVSSATGGQGGQSGSGQGGQGQSGQGGAQGGGSSGRGGGYGQGGGGQGGGGGGGRGGGGGGRGGGGQGGGGQGGGRGGGPGGGEGPPGGDDGGEQPAPEEDDDGESP